MYVRMLGLRRNNCTGLTMSLLERHTAVYCICSHLDEEGVCSSIPVGFFFCRLLEKLWCTCFLVENCTRRINWNKSDGTWRHSLNYYINFYLCQYGCLIEELVIIF